MSGIRTKADRRRIPLLPTLALAAPTLLRRVLPALFQERFQAEIDTPPNEGARLLAGQQFRKGFLP